MQNKQLFKEFIEKLFNHYTIVKPWQKGATELEEMNKKVSGYLEKCENISEAILLLASCGNNFIVNHCIAFLVANENIANSTFKDFQKYLRSPDTSKSLLEKYNLAKGINSQDGQVLSQWQDEPISLLTLKALNGLVQGFAGMPVKEDHPIVKYVNEYLIDSLIKLTESKDPSTRLNAGMVLGYVGSNKEKIKPILKKIAKENTDNYVKKRVSYALEVFNKL